MTTEQIALVLVVAGLLLMAWVLGALMGAELSWSWPPVRLGRPRRSTWDDITGGVL